MFLLLFCMSMLVRGSKQIERERERCKRTEINSDSEILLFIELEFDKISESMFVMGEWRMGLEFSLEVDGGW